jgi:hypothetical protein
MPKSHQALEKLSFSKRQQFFWVEDAKIFIRLENLPPPVLRHVYRDRFTGKDMSQQEYAEAFKVALKEGKKFSVSHRTMWTDAGDPANLLSGIPADKVAEYRAIVQSRNAATSKLLNQIEGQKVSKTGKILAGNTRLDEKTFALRLVQKQQSLKPMFPMLPNPQATDAELLQQLKNPALKPGFHDLISQVIAQATQENDISFLRKISRKPSGGKKLQSGFSPLQEFLVDFWCGQCNGRILDRSDLPPLCFFTDDALESYCAYVLGNKSDQLGDVGRQRRRMGLIQAQSPVIRFVIPDGDGILLKDLKD